MIGSFCFISKMIDRQKKDWKKEKWKKEKFYGKCKKTSGIKTETS